MKAVVSKQRVSLASGELTNEDPAYANRISLYGIVPCENVTLTEFERFGEDRLKCLQEMDAAKSSGARGEVLNNRVNHYLEKYLPLRRGNPEDVRKDVLSHYVLRLAFCAQQHRQWFLNTEAALLKHRLTSMGEKIPEFLQQNGLDYRPIDENDFAPLRDDLAIVYGMTEGEKHNASMYYRVPFLDAVMLLKGRRCFLQNGFAILHESCLVEIVVVHFKTALSKALSTTVKAHAQFSQDERLQALLSKWSNGYLSGSGSSFASSGGVIDMTKIDQLADVHYPLCMKHQHRALRLNHHLMHTGRMQYGLFLKGMGVSMDDSINFWRNEFLKKPDIDEKVFNSRYAYSIRHNYGKEGKRMDYSPYGCVKIINAIPGVNEHHGCPFRNSKREELMQDMQSAGIGPIGAAEVLKLLDGHHYQIACKKYFDLTHPDNKYEEAGTIHPNTYFSESVRYWKEKTGGADKDKEDASGKAVVGRSSQLAPADGAQGK